MLDIKDLIFASSEDRKLFLIHDIALKDDHEFVAPVIDLARRAGLELVTDDVNRNVQYPSSIERLRWFA